MQQILRLFLIFTWLCAYSLSATDNVHFLSQEQRFDCMDTWECKRLQIYCYTGRPKYIVHLWQSVSLQITSKSNSFVQYHGSTPEEVTTLYESQKSSWSFNLFTWKQNYVKLNPFNQSCIGLESDRPYSVLLHVIRIDYWKVIRLLLGVFLFLSAEKLSKNTLFYYVAGITLGICMSFLILIYFLSKMFPRKPVMYGVAAFGWTLGVYLIQILWDNIRVIIISYREYVLWYIFTSGLISFIVCYRWGPVTNERTRNLIKWFLQSVGLISVFLSSEFQEASMGQVIVLLIVYNTPKSWLLKSRTYWKRKFPPKVKLLSNDEYYQQGVRETSKALEELRNYCSSPDCNQWKVALKLKDVKRFASFIEGNSHLSDDEILEYESSLPQLDITDDEEVLTDEDD